MLKKLLLALCLCSVTGVYAQQESTVTSKISKIKIGANDPATIYFQTEQMPPRVTEWFYVRAGAGDDSAGCPLAGNSEFVNRTYSMLLAARTSGMPLYVHYCIDRNGYGLVRFTQY